MQEEQYKGDLISLLETIVERRLTKSRPLPKPAPTFTSPRLPIQSINDTHRAFCHLCTTGFASINDLTNHLKDKHRVWKG